MVKVEMEERQDSSGNTIIALAFECSREDEHEIIDAVRVAMFSDKHEKRGGYANSNRLIVEINTGKSEEK
jgi:hypothetical protein